MVEDAKEITGVFTYYHYCIYKSESTIHLY